MGRGRFAVLLAGASLGVGCITHPSNPAATQPTTDINPVEARPSYWYDQPAVAEVAGGAFDPLWEAARKVAHDYHFTIDRTDYRHGVLTTEPQVSRQFWELWRNDVVDAGHLLESSLATERRTIRFEFLRDEQGNYIACPKVLIERYSLAERRVTTVWQYREALRGRNESLRMTAGGEEVPNAYWYAVGRDHPLERELAAKVRDRLGR